MLSEGQIREAVKRVVMLIVRRDFQPLERTLPDGRILTAEMIAEPIDHYGEDLVFPPGEAFRSHWDVMKIDGQLQWSAQMPLWNAREGRSDLTVELTIYDDHGIPKVEIDGIATL